MAKRSKADQLPPAIKQWLDTELVKGSFSGYVILEQEINRLLRAAGADFQVGKSSLHRYGSQFEDRIKALKLVSEQAKALIEGSPDDEDAVSQALIRMTQEKLFNIVLQLQVDPGKLNLSAITRAIADLSRASISGKKYAADVRSRILTAVEDVDKITRSEGLSAEAANTIRQKILGIGG